jgi:hypothetical protein
MEGRAGRHGDVAAVFFRLQHLLVPVIATGTSGPISGWGS